MRLLIRLKNCRAVFLTTGKHKPSGTPELGVSLLAWVRAPCEASRSRQAGKAAACRADAGELGLSFGSFLSQPRRIFQVGYPIACVPGGAGQGLCAQEQQLEQHLCSCKQHRWPSSSSFQRGPLSHWHRAAVGTQLVSFIFKAPVEAARETRICSQYRVKTLPGSAQAAGI